MKGLIAIALAVAVGTAPVAALAQPQGMGDSAPIAGPADAPAGSVEIPLYGAQTPGSKADTVVTRFMGRETVLRNITYPTLTPVLPDPARANGAAVIVAAGGGFQMLSLQNEGWRVAQALADKGIAAFVLKYRLNPTPRGDDEFLKSMMAVMQQAMSRPGQQAPEIKDPAATEDVLAALRMVRARAGEWKVDPDRVGTIGFSAGSMASLLAVLEAGKDPNTRGPDFFGYIYGPMAAVDVPKDAPPMFAALAMDDPLFGNGDFSIVSAWKAARRPVELHAYQSGSHGFGMGRPGTTSTLLLEQFTAWMAANGWMKDNK